MSEDADTLVGLFGPRLPDAGWGEVLIAVAIGLVLMAALSFFLSLFQSAQPREKESLAAAFSAASDLPENEKIVALGLVLKRATDAVAPGAEPWRIRAQKAFGLNEEDFAEIGPVLYRPNAKPDVAAFEAVVAKVLKASPRG